MAHFSLESAHPASTTVGSKSALQEFLGIATDAGCLRLAQRLIQVSDCGDAHDKFAPVLHLVAAADSLRTLAEWADSDIRLRPWATLSSRLWHADGLMRRFPAVLDANEVVKDFHGELAQRYLAAMAASRLPEAEVDLLVWLRAVKLWLLVLAVEASEAGYVFERSLRTACDEVRRACEDAESPRIAWLRKIVSEPSPSEIDSLERQLTSAANKLRESKASDVSPGQRALTNALARVVAREWRDDTSGRGQPLWQGELAPWPIEPTPTSVDGRDPPTPPSDSPLEADDDGGSSGSTDVDPDSTPGEQQAKAKGVLLVNQAEGHMLAWDWHSLILGERDGLIDLIEALTQPEQSLRDRLGGALIAVALLTSNSARRVTRIKTGHSPEVNWKLDAERGQLHRTAPRRSARWRLSSASSDQASRWVRPLSGPWTLQLAPNLASALRESLPARGRSLRSAWDAVSPEQGLEAWVNTLLATSPGLERLTSPSLARAQRLSAFQSIADHALARLVSSNSQTVLPSPCSYGAYTGTTVQAALEPPFARIATWVGAESVAASNAAGSEMDVDSARVAIAMASLAESVEAAAAANDWVAHHNRLTALCIVALLACTGARPTSSPFQTLAWFNFESRWVFVDDKAAGSHQSSRLCILTPEVVRLVRDVYLPHLRRLCDAIGTVVPTVGEALGEVLRGDPQAHMPLFFFVRTWPEFDWTEIDETSLAQQCGPDWPLPWNFPRHRLATGLRRVGLDAEIIDALLGHGEAGSETHGANSLRTLSTDLEEARIKVDALSAELKLSTAHLCSEPEIHVPRAPTRPALDSRRVYGTEARRQRRDRAHGSAASRAIDEIQSALNGRAPDTLTGDEWEAIGRKMLLRPDGMPQPLASIRYAAYEDYLNRLWHERGTRPRMRRRFTIPSPARAVVTESAVFAFDRIAALRHQFDRVIEDLERRRIDAKLARALAAIDICLNAHIADSGLLVSIVQRPNVVTVKHQDQWFIESFEGKNWSDGAPLRRFAVTERSIDWILAGSQLQRQMLKPMPIPETLRAFAAQLDPQTVTVPQLLIRLAAIIDQCNVLQRTGLEAAVLAGRVKMSALPHSDLVRATEGSALAGLAQAKPESNPTVDDPHWLDDWDDSKPRPVSTPEACRGLLREIGKVLSGTSERSAKAAEIEAQLRRSGFINGDLPFALGRWIASLLRRTAKTHDGDLALSTVERYFNALASKVTAVGYKVHLVDMDGDELTTLYDDLLRAPSLSSVTRVRKPRGKSAGLQTEKAKASSGPETDNYAAHRLVEFHQFIASLHGLEDPDWSEIGDFSDIPSGRPGLLTTAEYLASLGSLLGTRASRSTPGHLLECAWVLMLCFRFGLRGGEAVGLHRDDWVMHSKATVALIRPNSTRGLKTVNAKRVVPLLEALTSLEHSITDEIIRRFDERPKEAADRAILDNLSATNFKYRRLQLVGRLLRLVKLASLSQGAIVHHARHGFANRAFALLFGRACGLGREGHSTAEHCESVRRLLLGKHRLDRRALWALCRLMGHGSPSVLIRSYLHLQVMPVDPLVGCTGVTWQARGSTIDVDAQPRDSTYLRNLPTADCQEQDTTPEPTLEKLLNYLRLRRVGHSRISAAYVVGIEPKLATTLDDLLTTCARRLEMRLKSDEPLATGLDLIARVTKSRFASLIKAARSAKTEVSIVDPFATLVNTVGSSRQILLFEAPHFQAMNAFIHALTLTRKDLTLVSPKFIAQELRDQIQRYNLGRFASKQATDGPPQQIDRALVYRAGDLTPTEFRQRVAFKLAGDKGLFESGYELVMTWCCFCQATLAKSVHRQSS